MLVPYPGETSGNVQKMLTRLHEDLQEKYSLSLNPDVFISDKGAAIIKAVRDFGNACLNEVPNLVADAYHTSANMKRIAQKAKKPDDALKVLTEMAGTYSIKTANRIYKGIFNCFSIASFQCIVMCPSHGNLLIDA